MKRMKRLFGLALALVLVLGMIPLQAVPAAAVPSYGSFPGSGKIVAHGLDVSAWQESGLNFQNFANAGYDFVILRCGTSVRKDSCFEEYYRSAKAAGLDVGAYYYSYATDAATARQEAYDVLEYLKGKTFEYPIYFDFEDPTQVDLSYDLSAQICRAFLDVIAENGYLGGLYSMSWMLNRSWVASSGISGTYEGWVAHVYSDAPNTGITSNEYNIYKDRYCSVYGMHQYSFTTYVNGAGPFDANVSYKDYPSIVKAKGLNGYKKTSWIEDACFDPWVYQNRYDDLAGKTEEQLKDHWLKYGIKEGRSASAILDLGYYVSNNADLKAAFGTDYEAAYNHFITKGYKEGRKSSRLFDGGYYCKRYPDVASSFKDDYLRHYVENGMAEGRRASATFDVNYYLYTRPDVAEKWPGDLERAARHYAGYGIKEGRAGYDSKAPVISDVQITDITAAGYTVTCTVTDNWGVSKVAFPTWTVANDQDDLAADFLNTQKGTKNGNTYTFKVKASDHNNEGGKYVTHIYAVDKGGNQTKLALETVTVEDPVKTTVTAKSFSLSFEDEVLVNFYYAVSDMTEVAEQGMLVFNSKPAAADIAKADNVYTGSTYVASKGWYMNTTDGIAAKRMGDTRYYAAYVKLNNGTYVYSDVYDYSPKKYAMNMLAKSDTSEKQKDLCVAMLNYGAAAQQYFNYNASDLVNSGLTAAQKNRVIGYSKSLFVGAVANSKSSSFGTASGFVTKAASVSFESAFSINFYMTPENAVVGGMTLYVWTPEAYAGASKLTTSNALAVPMTRCDDGRYFGSISGIAAKALDKTYYVTAVYKDTQGTQHNTGIIAYSLSKYCMGKAVAGNAMQALAAATAMYGYYAAQYFG